MYADLFYIIQYYIFEAALVTDLTPYQELTCTQVATFGCLFLIAIPFVAVFWFFKRFF